MVEIRKLKVTCIERKYKVQSEKAVYVINAKREFNEDLTDKLLHEDMELKTFLSEYEIEKVDEEVPKAEIKKIEIPKAEIKETIQTKNKKAEKVPESPTPEQRISIVLLALPEEFALEDVAKYYKERDEKQDIQKLKRQFSYTLHYLKKHDMIKIINPEVNARLIRYRKVEGAAEKIKSLNEQQKLPLEAMA